jgi:hypothetical protein
MTALAVFGVLPITLSAMRLYMKLDWPRVLARGSAPAA